MVKSDLFVRFIIADINYLQLVHTDKYIDIYQIFSLDEDR